MDPQLKEQQDLYDRGWRGGLEGGKEQRGNLRTNLDFLARTNLLKPGGRILEIGCGIGAVVSELARQGYHVTGTDISRVAIEYGLAKYGSLDLQCSRPRNWAFADGQFECRPEFRSSSSTSRGSNGTQ